MNYLRELITYFLFSYGSSINFEGWALRHASEVSRLCFSDRGDENRYIVSISTILRWLWYPACPEKRFGPCCGCQMGDVGFVLARL